MASFVVTAVVLGLLAVRTESRIASGDMPEGLFSRTSTFHVSEEIASYREYLLVAGFDDKKRALREFLQIDP